MVVYVIIGFFAVFFLGYLGSEGGGKIVVGILIVCLCSIGFYAYRSRVVDDVLEIARTVKYENQLDQLYAEFCQNKIGELTDAGMSLQRLRAEYSRKISGLETDFKNMGRDPSLDADLKAWRSDMAFLDGKIALIELQSKKAFIAHLKYQLAPAEDLRIRMGKQSETICINAQAEAFRYRELVNKVSL